MKYVQEYNDQQFVQKLLNHMKTLPLDRSVKLMEVCGTHTMAIARYGIKSLLPENIQMLSGPGCPVCVTPAWIVDAAVQMVERYHLILCTFGDMFRVPGTDSSLENIKAKGRDIRIVSSTLEALNIAAENPDRQIVFLGVGFETTAPTVALSIKQAQNLNLGNYSVFSAHKTMPQALKKLSESELKVDGFLLPGHVSTIIGIKPYTFLAEEYQKACVVTGFESTDILSGIYRLLKQISEQKFSVEIQYTRAVTSEGNLKALKILSHVFQECDSVWRGIGMINGSGLAIRPEYRSYNAALKFPVNVKQETNNRGCRCGDVLTGKIEPEECPLFGNKCLPDSPAGPCMISQEGSCAAAFQYDSKEGV